MKKLVIAVLVAGAMPVLAAPPHEKPGLRHQNHESAAFDRGPGQRAGEARAERSSTGEKAKNETSKDQR